MKTDPFVAWSKLTPDPGQVTTRLTAAGWLTVAALAVLVASALWLEQPVGVAFAVGLALALATAWHMARRSVVRMSADWLVPMSPRVGDEVVLAARFRGWRGVPPCTLWAWQPASRRHDAVARIVTNGDRPLRVTWPGRFPRRGLVTLPPLGVELALPFGVVAARTLISPPATVMVLPISGIVRRALRDRLARWLESRAVAQVPGDEEFDRLRDYRPGDPPRHIHWPASARHHRLLIAERHEPVSRHLALVLDTAVPRDHARFEHLVAVAATLVEHLCAQGWTLSLHGAWLDPGGAHGDRQQLLEALAVARIATTPVIDSLPLGRLTLVLAVSTVDVTGVLPEPLVLQLDECAALVRLPRQRD